MALSQAGTTEPAASLDMSRKRSSASPSCACSLKIFAMKKTKIMAKLRAGEKIEHYETTRVSQKRRTPRSLHHHFSHSQ